MMLVQAKSIFKGSKTKSFGQKVKKGDAIMHLDLDYLKNHTETISSPIICTDASDNMDIKLLASGKVKALEPLFDIYFYR